MKIENGKAGFSAYNAANTYSANSNTVFIVVDSDDKYDDYDVTVYTGIKNVPDIDAIAGKTVSAVALDNKGAVAKVVYIEDGDISGTGSASPTPSPMRTPRSRRTLRTASTMRSPLWSTVRSRP